MRIDLLYFEGCPSWQAALENLRAAAGDTPIHVIRVSTVEQAQVERFCGSPTIRANGVDIFPVDDPAYGLACRVYHTPAGPSGVPTVEMIRAALQN